MVVSLLYFSCCVYVCLCCIWTYISSEFISSSFSASMRSTMPYFPGTTLDHLIDTSCRMLDICSTLICLNLNSFHTSCILIGIQQPSEKFFPPIHIPRVLLKNPHVVLRPPLTALAHPMNILGDQILLML